MRREKTEEGNKKGERRRRGEEGIDRIEGGRKEGKKEEGG